MYSSLEIVIPIKYTTGLSYQPFQPVFIVHYKNCTSFADKSTTANKRGGNNGINLMICNRTHYTIQIWCLKADEHLTFKTVKQTYHKGLQTKA